MGKRQALADDRPRSEQTATVDWFVAAAPMWPAFRWLQGNHRLSGAAGVLGPLLASTPLKTLCFTASISLSDNTPSPSVSPRVINIRMKNAESWPVWVGGLPVPGSIRAESVQSPVSRQ